jgi:hypothetical protein
MGVQNLGAWFKRTYDRLIATLVLLILLILLIVLALQVKILKTRQEDLDRELGSLKPRHASAQPADKGVFDAAHQGLRDPLQVSVWSNRVMVPELRVRCVNCERPIAYAAPACPFCHAAQPVVLPGDIDRDGMPDEWEEQYALNPRDADDAGTDADQDGFSNREEFDNKTNPKDPASHPPLVAKMSVKDIKPIPFKLVFKGVSRVEGGKQLFQLNLTAGGRTFWKEMNQDIEGFKLVKFEETGAKGKPTLTLQRGEKLIPLEKNVDVPYNEYEVILLNTMNNTTFNVRVDGQFDLKGAKYEVKSVDYSGMRVLIHDPITGTDVWKSRQ